MDFIKQNLTWIIGGAVALVVLYVLLGGKKQKAVAEQIQVNVKCKKCGWQGSVSKYNQVCRKCAGKDLAAF